MVYVFNNVGERSTAKNYHPVSLLSVFIKVFEELVNNNIADHLKKCDLFSHFQYGFRSSRSKADLLTVIIIYFTFILSKLEFGFYKSHIYGLFTPVASDRIAKALNRSEAN